MSLDGTSFPVDESRPLLFMMLWMQSVLDRFETVEEVLQSLRDLTIDGWTWHFFTADRTGDAAVIEFLDGETHIFRGPDLPLPVLCNTKYAEELENLSRYEGYGGSETIDLADSKQARFIHAARMIADFDPGQHDPMDYAVSILEQFDRGGTQWSFACDIPNLKVRFKTRTMPRYKELDLRSFDLGCGTPVKMLDIDSDLEGRVEKHFVDYSPELNLRRLEEAFEALGDGWAEYIVSMGGTVEGLVSRLIGYSEKTSCEE